MHRVVRNVFEGLVVLGIVLVMSTGSSWAFSWPEYPNGVIGSLPMKNFQTQENYGSIRGIAVTPDDTHAYVACDNQIVLVNLSGPSVETVLGLGGAADVAITPNGQYLYGAMETGCVKAISTSDHQVRDSILLDYGFQRVAITPDGHYAYVTRYELGNHLGYIHVLDVWNYSQPVDQVAFPGRWLKGIDFTPDGQYACVVDYANNELLVLATSDRSVVTSYTDTFNLPEDVAITPDGSHAYVTNLGLGQISAVDLSAGTVSAIPVLGSEGVAVTPDGQFVYVTGGSSYDPMDVVRVSDHAVDNIDVYSYNRALAIKSDGTRVYATQPDFGGWDNFLVIGYVLEGYKLTSIPSEPPSVSNIMAGGEVVRYYRVTDYENKPESGISIKVEGNSLQWDFVSGGGGLLTVSVPVDDLGSPGDEAVCSITELDGEPIDPLTFGVHIVPREVASHYRFGSGASIGAAVGLGVKVGLQHGLTYTRKETDLTIDSDDIVEVENFTEISAGVFVGGGIGGGIKGVAYAKAEAEAGVDLLASFANQYQFTSPYTGSDKKCRAGLLLTQTFLGAAPPLISDMAIWLADNYSSFITEYKSGEIVSMGARVYGEASEGAGLGVAGDDEVYLGIGVGAGISGDAQVMAKLISSYQYGGGSLSLTELGAGVNFNCGVDVSAGVTATAVGNGVRAGIGADVSYEYELTLYASPSGELRRLEIAFSAQKNWGIGVDGTIGSGSDSTDTVILVIDGSQIVALAADIADIAQISSYFSGSVPEDILLGPTRLQNEFRNLFARLSTMDITYRIEHEKGTGFSFSPSIDLALGAEIEAGVSFNMEKAVTYTREEGHIVGTDFDSKIPVATYTDDAHVPSLGSLSYTDVLQETAEVVYDLFCDAGEFIQGAAETLGDTVLNGYHWTKQTLSLGLVGPEEQKFAYSLRSYLEPAESYQGPGEVFLFSSPVEAISDLAAKIASPVTITNGHAQLTITPGQNEAQLTISYTDQQISGLQEDQLCIHTWHLDTHRWQSLVSVVNTNLNQVTAWVTRLGTFSVFLAFPTGSINLTLDPELVDLQNPENLMVTSGPISDSTGAVVPDGTLVTTQTLRKYSTTEEPFGQILSPDEDPGTPGVQIVTVGGSISCTVAAPNEQGEGIIRAQSVSGDAEGNASFRTDASPSVDLTAPLSGAIVRGTIEVAAVASDDSGVVRVDFIHDEVLFASDATSPYGLSWDTTSISEGPCVLSAVAYDLYGLTATDAVSIVIDRTDPLVQISSPVSGDRVTQTVQIRGAASDVNLEEYRLDYGAGLSPTSWSAITTSSVAVSAGILANWDSTAVNDGTYTLRLQAEDKAGNATQTNVWVIIDNTPPAVGWKAPNEGSVRSGTTILMVSATDSGGVTWVEFYCDQTFIVSNTSTTNNYTGQFDTTSVSDGVHTLTAVAYDLAANAASDSIWIVVDNEPCSPGVTWQHDPTMYTSLILNQRNVPAFGDLDGDGDLDLVIGDTGANLRYFKNTGTPNVPVWTEDASMFSGIDIGNYDAAPALGDLDGDDDLDLLVGAGPKTFRCFENTGTATSASWTESTALLNGIPDQPCDYPAPALGDLDGDGDLDLTLGAFPWNSQLQYYENIGSATEPEWSQDWSMYQGMTTSALNRPTLGDLDGDGDLDLTIAGWNGGWPATGLLYYYQNEGTTACPAWMRCDVMFQGINPGAQLSAGLADLDDDGDLDLTLGEYDAVLNYYRSLLSEDTTPPQVSFLEPASGALVSGTITLTAAASDTSDIDRVEFYAAGTFLGAASSNTYALSWDTTTVSEGTCTLTAVAYDTPGLSASTDLQVEVLADSKNPVVKLLEHPGHTVVGQGLAAEVRFTWMGTDDVTSTEDLVYQYQLEGDGQTEDWSVWTLDTSVNFTLPGGEYIFQVRAKDQAGNYAREGDPGIASWQFNVQLPLCVYPNPFQPTDEDSNTGDWGSGIIFQNLRQGSNISIYTLSGELVQTSGLVQEALWTWNSCNSMGHQVASGIYFYLVKCDGQIAHQGKLVVIR